MHTHLLESEEPAVDRLLAAHDDTLPLAQKDPAGHSEQFVPLFPKKPGWHIHWVMLDEPGGDVELEGHA